MESLAQKNRRGLEDPLFQSRVTKSLSGKSLLIFLFVYRENDCCSLIWHELCAAASCNHDSVWGRERERGAETCRCNISAVIIERDKFPLGCCCCCAQSDLSVIFSIPYSPIFLLSAFCLIVFIYICNFSFYLFIRGAENVTGNNGANRNLTPTCARLFSLGQLFLSFFLSIGVVNRFSHYRQTTDTSDNGLFLVDCPPPPSPPPAVAAAAVIVHRKLWLASEKLIRSWWPPLIHIY